MRFERLKPLFEGVSILLFILFLDFTWGAGNHYIDVYPHPFWIPIILISALYGSSYGILIVLIATFFLYAGNVPEQKFSEVNFEYELRLIFRPLIWLVIAYTFGLLKDRSDTVISSLQAKNLKMDKQLKSLAEHLESERETKEQAEKMISAQQQTLATTYEIFKELKSLNPAAVLRNIDQLVLSLMNPNKFSVYACGAYGLEATTCYGWDEKDTFLRRFPIDHPMYKTLVAEKKLISIANKDEQKILDEQGIVASPLINADTGEVFGVLKIEELPFENLTLSNLVAFECLCSFIGVSYANACKFELAQEDSLKTDIHGVFSRPAFEVIVEILSKVDLDEKFEIYHLTIASSQRMKPSLVEEMVAILYKEFPNKIYCFSEKSLRKIYMLILGGDEKEIENKKVSTLDQINQIEAVQGMTFTWKCLPLNEWIKSEIRSTKKGILSANISQYMRDDSSSL